MAKLKQAGRSSAIGSEIDRAMTRAERSEATQRAIFEATVKVVGQRGYADASIGRIAQYANVAQGTFYNYYASQQQLFNNLLPLLGEELIGKIRACRNEKAGALDRERAGFQAFFDYLLDVPEFYRILTEAETFAPESHKQHTKNMADGYVRTLARAKAEGWLTHYDEHEFEAIGYMLIAIRHYLAMRYTYRPDGVNRVPEWLIETYMKLLSVGLFAPPNGRMRARKATRRAAEDPAKTATSRPRIVEIGPHEAVVEAHLGPEQSDETILELGRAAAIAMADAVSGSPQRTASFDLTMLRHAIAGRAVAVAAAEGSSPMGLIIAVRIAQGNRDGSPLALVRVCVTPRET